MIASSKIFNMSLGRRPHLSGFDQTSAKRSLAGSRKAPLFETFNQKFGGKVK
jgi:hypothetical protein